MEINNNQKGMGIIDFTKTFSLGNLLIFIEDLKIYQERLEIKEIDLKIITGKNTTKVFNLLLPLIYQYLEVSKCQLISSLDIKKIYNIKNEYQFVFPSREEFLSKEFTLDSTKIVQDFFNKKRYIPKLVSNEKESIRKFLQKKSSGKTPVAIHLKNNHLTPNDSNANVKEWYNFLNCCWDRQFPVQFFLVGDDQIEEAILSLPNVTRTRNENLNILDDLIIIEQASLFMGMCSGPFQIALFNDKPYIVFKNPTHHKNEMIKEIGVQNKYPFATEKQKILRVIETKEILLKELLKVFPNFINIT